MNPTLSASVYFDFFERHGLWLFPVRSDTKVPAIHWKKESSADRAQWQAWIAQGHMLAINAAASGVILIDVDVGHVGPELARKAYEEFMTSLHAPALPHYCQSQGGGFHVMVKRPPDMNPENMHGVLKPRMTSHARPLAEGEKDAELISVRNRGYCVAPGSIFKGKPYILTDAASGAHASILELTELLRLPVVEHRAAGTSGDSDPDDLAAVVAALDAIGYFDDEYTWKFHGIAPIKLALGDTEAGRTVARQITWEDVSEEEFLEQWNRKDFVTVDDGTKKLRRVGSLIHDAEQLTGQKFHVRKSVYAQFSGVDLAALPPHAAHPVAPAAPHPPPPGLPPGAVSMLGGGAPQPRQRLDILQYSEIEIAGRFVREYGTQLSYIKARKRWLYWDGKRWHVDETGYVADIARRHCYAESSVAAGAPGVTDAIARSLCSDRNRKAVLNLASDDQRIASRVDDWDSDHWLLGTPAGVVDLRTSTLREARPEDRVTKSTSVTPSGDGCPMFLKFLARATGNDVELQSYLQRLCGYILTGDTSEETLHFNYDEGGGGKGTFMHAIEGILRDYHTGTAIATLTEAKNDRHPTELAALQGARLVTCSETERGKRWAESRIKEMTGRDAITARFMKGDFFNYIPTFKIVVSGNHKPHLRADTAMRRRFQLIPFTAKIPEDEKDTKLGEKLRAEWPSILAWMIKGCAMWQRDGLAPPATVVDATNIYMNEEAEDCLTAWLAECCDTDPKAETPNKTLYPSYKFYAERSSERPMSNVEFGKELRRLHYKVERGRRGAYVVGLKLADPPPDTTQKSAPPPANWQNGAPPQPAPGQAPFPWPTAPQTPPVENNAPAAAADAPPPPY